MPPDLSTRAVNRRLWAFSWPIGLEAMMDGWLLGADALMVASLGPDQVAGVALALAICAIPNSILWGLAHGKALLLAMALGSDREDRTNIDFSREVLGAGLILLLIAGLVFSALSIATPYFVSAVGVSGEVADHCRDYVLVSLLLSPIAAAHFFAADALRASGHSKYASASLGIALLLNIFFNYVLIFGHLGFPAMGVAGAALGTGLSRLGSAIIVLRKLRSIDLLDLGAFHKAIANLGQHFQRMMHTAVPVAIERVSFSALHMVAIGLIATLGAAQLVAYELATRMTGLATSGGNGAAQFGVGFEIARMKNVANAPYRLIIRAGTWMGLATTAPMSLGVILATPLILNAIMGEEHAPLAISVCLLELTLSPIWTLGLVLNGAARGLNETRWPMKTSLASIIAYVGWILVIRELGGGVLEITVAGHISMLFVIGATIWKLRRTIATDGR